MKRVARALRRSARAVAPPEAASLYSPSTTAADRAGGGESAFARGLVARASEPTGGGSREVGESSKRLPR